MSTSTLPVLTPEQIEQFHTVGFLRVNQVFTPAEMDEIDAAVEEAHALAMDLAREHNLPGSDQSAVEHMGSRTTYKVGPTLEETSVRHISYVGGMSEVLSRYGKDPRLLALATPLLGSSRMQQLINQVHYKKPGTGITFDWHQDATHRGLNRGMFEDINGKGSYVQIALAIDDMTDDNGPLQFIPNTGQLGHKGPPLPPDAIDPSTAVAPMLKRGDVSLFGPYTIHGSTANLSNKARRVFINGYAYPDANKKQLPQYPSVRWLEAPSE